MSRASGQKTTPALQPPFGALVALTACAVLARPSIVRVVVVLFVVLLAWVWLVGPVDTAPNRRHPMMRKAAKSPRVAAWRTRDRWIPSWRAPRTWAVVFGGSVVLGAAFAFGMPAASDMAAPGARDIAFWALAAPAFIFAGALLLDATILLIGGLWVVMLPMLLALATIPAVVVEARLPVAVALGTLAVGVWFADLARALYQRR